MTTEREARKALDAAHSEVCRLTSCPPTSPMLLQQAAADRELERAWRAFYVVGPADRHGRLAIEQAADRARLVADRLTLQYASRLGR